MSTTDNSSAPTSTGIEEGTDTSQGFAETWLNSTIISLETVKHQLKNDPVSNRINGQEVIDLLEDRITSIRKAPNTLVIMEALQAANLAKEGALQGNASKIAEAKALLEAGDGAVE